MQPTLPPNPPVQPPHQSSSSVRTIAIVVSSVLAVTLLLIIAVTVWSVWYINGQSPTKTTTTPTTTTQSQSTSSLAVTSSDRVSFAGGTVDSLCYSFTISDESYSLDASDSQGCSAYLNIKSGDSLTAISVQPQSGPMTQEQFSDKLQKSGQTSGVDVVCKAETNSARFDYAACRLTDKFGIKRLMYFYPTARPTTINGDEVAGYVLVMYDLTEIAPATADSFRLK